VIGFGFDLHCIEVDDELAGEFFVGLDLCHED